MRMQLPARKMGGFNMKTNPILHKGNYKKMITIELPFRQYKSIPSPMCNSKVGGYSNRNYYMVRNWAQVTCKHCLKLKDKK